MEQLVKTLSSDKLVLLIILLIVSIIIYFILKRLIKLIVIAVIMLVLFTGYMYYKGEKVPAPVSEFINEGKKTKEKIDMINRTIEVIRNDREENHSSKGSSSGSSSE